MEKQKGFWNICEKCGKKTRKYHRFKEDIFLCYHCYRDTQTIITFGSPVSHLPLNIALQKIYIFKPMFNNRNGKEHLQCYCYFPLCLAGKKFKIVLAGEE